MDKDDFMLISTTVIPRFSHYADLFQATFVNLWIGVEKRGAYQQKPTKSVWISYFTIL